MKKKRFKINGERKAIKPTPAESNTLTSDPEPVEVITDNTQDIEIRTIEEPTMNRSHLKRKLERQSKRTFILTSLGLIILFVFLIIFGQSLLINFSVLIGGTKTSGQNTTEEEQAYIYIAPPILDPISEATNSASLRVTGALVTDVKAQIKLYVNGELEDVTQTGKDDTFTFTDVKLKEGENKIKAIALVKDNKSKDSNVLTISYVKKAPSLTIDQPQENATYSGDNNTITIKGKTDPGLTVTVNDYLAVIRSDGTYTYTMKLQSGENKIKVVAVDEAGNKTTKEIKVNYN